MTLLYGYNEGEDRMKEDKMTFNRMVEIDHDFYTNNYLSKAK